MARRSFRILFVATLGVGGQILSAKLRRRGHIVRLVSVETAARMRTGGYDFILASTYIDDLRLATTLDRARALSPNAKIILGGPGLSSQPHAFLRHYKADFGLIGEADNTIGELFDRFERFGTQPPWHEIKSIDGACYRAANNRVYVNGQLPHVSADEIDWEHSYFIVGETAHVLVQRGCPNHCTFCQKWFGDCVRSAPLKTIIAILEEIAIRGISSVSFAAELFLPRRETILLCRAIRLRGLHRKLWFGSDFTVGSLLTPKGEVNTSLLRTLKRTGFYFIGLGLESVVEERLNYFNKPHKPKQAFKLIAILKKMGFEGHFYMVGRLPKRNDRVVHEIVDVCVGLSISGRNPRWDFVYHSLIMAPGSAIYERSKGDPSLFAEIQTGRKLHPQTNMSKWHQKSGTYCVACIDPILRLTGEPHHMLWGLEKRYDRLPHGGERDRLARELPLVRKAVSRLPKLAAQHALEIERTLRQDIIRAAIWSEGFLDRWRNAWGVKAEIIEKGLLSSTRAQGDTLTEDDLLDILRCCAVGDPQAGLVGDPLGIIPRDDLAIALGMFYDNLVSSQQARLDIALPELKYLWLDEGWQEALLEVLREVGRETFIEESLSNRPLAFTMAFLVRSQLEYLGWSGRLAAIRPHKDSRPILTPLTLAPFNRLMARAARDVTI